MPLDDSLDLSLEAEGRIDALCDRFEESWKQGERLEIESLLTGVDPRIEQQATQELILLEAELRRRSGDWPQSSDYRERFPELDEFLQTTFAATDRPRLSAEELLKLMRESQLLEPQQMEQVRAAAGESPTASALVGEAVRLGMLTPWQAGELLAGRSQLVLGRYRLVEELGRGGMGTVYKALRSDTGELVALKVMADKCLERPEAVTRFMREFASLAKLDHPRIVKATEVEQAHGKHYLVMQYMPGQDLRSIVKQYGRLSIAWSCECIRQAALGLAHAHERGFVHRDIKPSNILVHEHAVAGPDVKILDLGLGRFLDDDASITHTGDAFGTVDYISPEQAEDVRHADTRSDIYSLGCTLFELLTARPPFEGETAANKLIKRVKHPAPRVASLRPEVPAELDEVIARMLAQDPNQRYQTPDAVAEALEPFAAAGGKAPFGGWGPESDAPAAKDVSTPIPGSTLQSSPLFEFERDFERSGSTDPVSSIDLPNPLTAAGLVERPEISHPDEPLEMLHRSLGVRSQALQQPEDLSAAADHEQRKLSGRSRVVFLAMAAVLLLAVSLLLRFSHPTGGQQVEQSSADTPGDETQESAPPKQTEPPPAVVPPVPAAQPVVEVTFDEPAEVGLYTESQLRDDWPALKFFRLGRAYIHDGDDALQGESGQCLRVLFPKDKYGASQTGCQFLVKLEPREEYYARYYVRFGDREGEHWEFAENGMLPGLVGGAANTGGRRPNGDGWSARLYWRSEGDAYVYLYHLDQEGDYGDALPLGHRFEPGRWCQVTQRVQVNRDGRRDGILQVWVDGDLALDRTDIRFRSGEAAPVDGFYFSSFWGSRPERAAHLDAEAFFDQIAITTEAPRGLAAGAPGVDE